MNAWGFPVYASGKNLPAKSGGLKGYGFDPWVRKICQRRT